MLPRYHATTLRCFPSLRFWGHACTATHCRELPPSAHLHTIASLAPTGPEAYSRYRELRVVGEHEISGVWEDDLALKVHAILHAKGVDWSSTDVIRIRYIDDDDPSEDVLWIGVRRDSLSYKVGIDVALQCKGILLDYGINDVEVEIRQSKITCSAAGPQLRQPTFDFFESTVTVDAREPLTPALGITICSQSRRWAEGTRGFFLSEGSGSKRLLLVTACHVVFPLDKDNNNLFERKSDSQHRHDILIFSDESFKQYLVSIQTKIRGQGDDEGAEKVREAAQRDLDKAEASVVALTAFHHELSTHWATEQSRVLGHVIFSPPIAVGTGPEQYTQDVAVIEIDASKIDPSSFPGNAINLVSTKFPFVTLIFMMHPNLRNTHNFNYPSDRLLRLRGTITDNEMRKATMYDRDNKPCIIVLKRGRTTGLTVGRANNVFSCTRKYFGDNNTGISKDWVVLPFDNSHRNRSGDFSAKGDSGSVVVDGAGGIGGLITGGAGKADRVDFTYVTPIGSYPKSGPSTY
ncbi:hypothetical protein EDB87DRAFT_1676932 [Lactarius vividus]|nr:hypothetical protein EDB87DRAFT_1676932 [Lactarius vividus]